MKIAMVILFALLTVAASAAPRRLPHSRLRYRSTPMVEIVRQVPWQTVAAGGAAAGTVVAAYKISDGVEDGLKTVAAENPEVFHDSLSVLTWPLRWAVLIALLGSGCYIWFRVNKKHQNERNQS